MSEKSWWFVALAICLASIGTICFIWYCEVSIYVPKPDQLADMPALENYLKKNATESSFHVPTGIFIQSLEFVGANDANLTGYIWQKYDDDLHAKISRGFIFPERIRSADESINKEYRHKDGKTEVIGWYFDVILRQPFDYSKYPLDKHNVWIRMWHKDFDRNVILTPDLNSYDSVRHGHAFGIDMDMVAGGWRLYETYFQYKKGHYDTNFGIDGYVGKKDFHELYFNIEIGRKFMNAFIINLVPLIIVTSMLFSVLMMTTSEQEKAATFGFSTSGAIGTTAALFFVVMLSHIQLREQFSGAGIVYIEQFYFAVYAAIFLVSLNIYLFSTGWCVGRRLDFIHYNDNFIPKVAFWPTLLVVLVVITLRYF